MLRTKLVIRILDEGLNLLGWAEAEGVAKGDGCLWILHTTPIFIETEGVHAWTSIHWCDVNVETRVQGIEKSLLKVGRTVELTWDGPAVTVGPAAGGLPPVTVRQPVVICVPAGSFGATGHA